MKKEDKLFTRSEMKAFGDFILAEKKKQVFDVIDKHIKIQKGFLEDKSLCEYYKAIRWRILGFKLLKTEMEKVFNEK